MKTFSFWDTPETAALSGAQRCPTTQLLRDLRRVGTGGLTQLWPRPRDLPPQTVDKGQQVRCWCVCGHIRVSAYTLGTVGTGEGRMSRNTATAPSFLQESRHQYLA